MNAKPSYVVFLNGRPFGYYFTEHHAEQMARALRHHKPLTGALIEVRRVNPGPRSVHTAKWDRCVKKVRAQGGSYDPYAVCTAQLGERGSIKAGHRRRNPVKGRVPPQLRPYLFKKGHGRIRRKRS